MLKGILAGLIVVAVARIEQAHVFRDLFADQVVKSRPTGPFDSELELTFRDKDDSHALIFACRRDATGWVKMETGGIGQRKADALAGVAQRLGAREEFFGPS